MNARQAVMRVCALLAGAGVTSLTPEVLRRGKLDLPEACTPLWLALHNVVAVGLQLDVWRLSQAMPARSTALQPTLLAQAASADVRHAVVTWLGAAHYPQHGMRQLRLQLRLEARQEAAAAARVAASDGEAGSGSDGGSAADDSEPGHSRHLLMALVWVLAKFGVLEALIERQRKPPPPSHTKGSGTSLPPFPTVGAGLLGRYVARQHLQLRQAITAWCCDVVWWWCLVQDTYDLYTTGGCVDAALRGAARRAERGAAMDASTMSEAAEGGNDVEALRVATDRLLLEYGRTANVLKTLRAHMDGRRKLHRKIHELQLSINSAREPLSPYETWLVATPRQADLHTDAITARLRELGDQPPKCTAAAVSLFFQWMTSVVAKCDPIAEQGWYSDVGGDDASADGGSGDAGQVSRRNWLRQELHELKKELQRVSRSVEAREDQFAQIREWWDRARGTVSEEEFASLASTSLQRMASKVKQHVPAEPLDDGAALQAQHQDASIESGSPSLLRALRSAAPPHMQRVIEALDAAAAATAVVDSGLASGRRDPPASPAGAYGPPGDDGSSGGGGSASTGAGAGRGAGAGAGGAGSSAVAPTAVRLQQLRQRHQALLAQYLAPLTAAGGLQPFLPATGDPRLA